MKTSARSLLMALGLCLSSTAGEIPPGLELGRVQAGSPGERFTRALAQAGPVVENASQVVGRILGLETIDSSALGIAPPQRIDRIRLDLLRVQDIPGKANRLAGPEGTALDAYSKDRVDPALVGKVITGQVIFRGDERGGLFWIYEVAPFSEESKP